MSDTATAPAFEQRHRLALALEHAGVNTEQMAAHLGCAPTTVRNYLSGRSSPRRATLIAWAQRTGVPFDWLVEVEKRSTGWLLCPPVAA